MIYLALTLVSLTGAIAFALRRDLGSVETLWAVMGGVYAVLVAMSLSRLKKQRLLRKLFSFKRGDPTIGILLGLLMLGGAWMLSGYVLPKGSAGRAWLYNIYMLVGDVESSWFPPVAITLIAIAEEVVWRGFVLMDLVERLGARRAVPVAALLYGAVHAPTLWTLGDELAGPNPILVLAAVGTGLVWGYLVLVFQRLWPTVICHAVFTYFGAAWLLVPPGQL